MDSVNASPTATGKPATILVLLARSVASARQTVSELVPAKSQRCDVFACDLADPASVEAVAAEIRAKTEQVKVLINNAAIQGPIGSLEHNDLGDWEQTILRSIF